jgi:tRNA nucleotidyltransferase (CCA-adding enzyme)
MTAAVQLPDGRRVDVATARQETYPEPTKLPVVASADIVADLHRRDFSVNAIALRLAATGVRELVDPCGGRADLAAGVVRVLCASSFADDPTRLIRAARFSTRLGFAVETRTGALVREAAEAALLARVTGARVRQEVVKLLTEPSPAAVVERLAAWEVIGQILPGYRPDRRAQAWLAQAPLALAVLREARRESAPTWPYLLGVLAFQAEADAVAQRLDLGGEAAAIVRAMRRAVATRLPSVLTRREAVSGAHLDRALRAAEFAGLIVYWLRSGPLGRRRLEQHACRLWRPEAGLNGHDLRAAGAPPGPAIGVGLDAARDARLEGRAAPTDQLTAALAAIEAWRRPARGARRER